MSTTTSGLLTSTLMRIITSMILISTAKTCAASPTPTPTPTAAAVDPMLYLASLAALLGLPFPVFLGIAIGLTVILLCLLGLLIRCCCKCCKKEEEKGLPMTSFDQGGMPSGPNNGYGGAPMGDFPEDKRAQLEQLRQQRQSSYAGAVSPAMMGIGGPPGGGVRQSFYG